MEPSATWVLRCFRCCKEFEAEVSPHPDMTSALENAICQHCGYKPPHPPLDRWERTIDGHTILRRKDPESL